MSFGKKVEAAVCALKAAGLPADLRSRSFTGASWRSFRKQGHKPSELPHPRTIARHLDRLEQRADIVTHCHSRDGADGVICALDHSEHEGDDEMEAAPGAIEEIRCGLMAVLMALPLRAPYWGCPIRT